ncbi:MAG: hypothetical protein GC137_10015 [Alphaproteobacteria bacterium]|nr:hypothetical protein [Alphaproteobacteria bacterium]
MEQDVAHVSAFLYILCAMSAMAFVLSPSLWLLKHIKSPGANTIEFSHALWLGQTKAFIFTLMTSIFISVWDGIFGGHEIKIFGETLILVIVSYAYFLQNQKSPSFISTYFKYIREVVAFGTLCILGWAVSLAIGFTMFFSLNYIFLINTSDLQIVSIMIPGLLWNIPIVMMYYHILQRGDLRPVLRGYGLYMYLWPILIAYLVLILPLAAEKVAEMDLMPKNFKARVV